MKPRGRDEERWEMYTVLSLSITSYHCDLLGHIL